MAIHPGRPTRSARSAFLVGILVAALVTSAVLAYEAVSAVRMHKKIAERTVRDYSAFALWQLAARVDRASEDALNAAMLRGIYHTFDGKPVGAEPLPPTRVMLSRFKRGVLEDLATHGLEKVPASFFAMELKSRDTSFDGSLTPELKQRVLGDLRDSAQAVGQEVLGRPGNFEGTGRRRPMVYRSAKSAMLSRHADATGTTMVVSTLQFRDTAWYFLGMTLDAAPLGAILIGNILREQPLFPPGLMHTWQNTDILSLALEQKTGAPPFATWGPATAGPRERLGLQGALVGLTATAAIPHAIADDLLIGGLPGSRLPLLLLLLVLTISLLATAIVQYRRDSELARLRGDFVSSVSHELRTPLAQIRLFADLLDSTGLSPAERRRSVQVIGKEARRLSFLVENILTFSAAERKAHALAARPIDVADMLHEVLESFDPVAARRDVNFDVDVEEGLCAQLDPDGFRRVLLNLIDNAVKYGPDGQRVRIEASAVNGALRLRVDDRGPGIPVEQRGKVWAPYYRLPVSVESDATGSGLGLSLVRSLVAEHGGSAEILDAPSGGTRVELTIPGASAVCPEQRSLAVGTD